MSNEPSRNCSWRLRRHWLAVLTFTVACTAWPEPGMGRRTAGFDHTVRSGSTARRGRPRKLSSPKRAVTLTLPEDTIATLRGIDRHLGRAIVRLTEPFAQDPPRRPAELATFGSLSVMVVSPTRGLIERVGAELVPLSDGRALLAIDSNQSIPAFELRLRDALGDPNLPPADRETFAAIADLLRAVRRDNRGTLLHRNILVFNEKALRAPGAKEGLRAPGSGLRIERS
jgi:hypothetical protein